MGRRNNWLDSLVAKYLFDAEHATDPAAEAANNRAAQTVNWLRRHLLSFQEGFFRISGPGVGEDNSKIVELLYGGEDEYDPHYSYIGCSIDLYDHVDTASGGEVLFEECRCYEGDDAVVCIRIRKKNTPHCKCSDRQ